MCTAAVAACMILMARHTEGTLICTPVNGWKGADALKTTSKNGGIAGSARSVAGLAVGAAGGRGVA